MRTPGRGPPTPHRRWRCRRAPPVEVVDSPGWRGWTHSRSVLREYADVAGSDRRTPLGRRALRHGRSRVLGLRAGAGGPDGRGGGDRRGPAGRETIQSRLRSSSDSSQRPLVASARAISRIASSRSRRYAPARRAWSVTAISDPVGPLAAPAIEDSAGSRTRAKRSSKYSFAGLWTSRREIRSSRKAVSLPHSVSTNASRS